MAVTVVKNVFNFLSQSILFVNTETSRDNRDIAPGAQSNPDIGAWVPWCTKSQDFPSHHFQIVDESSGSVLWYIWQQNAGDGDWVRFSRQPFGDVVTKFAVGATYNLFLFDDGSVKVTKTS